MDSTTEPEASLRKQIRQQERVADLGRRALETDDRERVLADACEVLCETLSAACSAAFEAPADGERLVVRGASGWERPVAGVTLAPAGPMEAALDAGDPVVEDLRDRSADPSNELLAAHDGATAICAPVGPSEDPWGVLGAFAADAREFDDHDVRFVQDVADVLAATIGGGDETTTGADGRDRTTDAAAEPRDGRDERGAFRFRQITENLDDVIWLSSPEKGEMLYVNPAYEEIWGRSRESLYEEPLSFLEAIHPDDRDRVREALSDQLDDEYEEEYRVVHPDGSVRWVRDRATTITEDGEVTKVAGIAEDVTERKRLRSELEKTLDRVTDAFYALDRDWRFTYVNDRAAELIDVDGTGLVGETIWDAFEWASDSVLREEYERAMETQEPTSFEFYYPEPLATWFEIHAYPSETGLSVYFRDVTESKEREQQLEQYRVLTEAARDVIVTIDGSHTIQTVNPAVEDVFGYEPAELEGESLTTIMPDRLADRHRAALARHLETGERSLDWDYVELPGKRADGAEIPLGISFDKIEYGGETYFTGIIRDVSGHKERERELELFRELIDRSNDSVLVVDPETGRFLDVNETACRRRGYSRDEFLELSVPDLQPEFEDRDEWRSYVEELRADGQRTFEGYHRRKDGSTYPVEINDTYVEIGEGDDREAYVLAVSRDVTERRERELELRERVKELTAIQLATNLLDTRDRPIDDLLYEFVEELPPSFQYPEITEARVRVGDHEATTDGFEPVDHTLTARTVTSSGAPIALEVVYLEERPTEDEGPFLAEERELVDTLVTLVKSHYERRTYIEELQEKTQRLEQFAYAASHDLQEPLRMVSSYLQLIERRYADELDADGEEFLDYAVDGADRMREMIRGLLEYSRVETRGDPLEPVDLDEVFADVLDDLQLRIEESDAEITAESLPEVRGDADQLRQVFQNLLDNAIEYSGDEPPSIHVGAERDGTEWELSVRDEGIGIDPDETDRIFQVFQRLHSREHHAGTGIGLALCQRIVERHGGEIWVDSEPGEGTTFSFTLPAAN